LRVDRAYEKLIIDWLFIFLGKKKATDVMQWLFRIWRPYGNPNLDVNYLILIKIKYFKFV